MENVIRDLRVKRGLVLIGIVLVAIGIAAGLTAVTIVGAVMATVGFVSAGGA
jgi:hypothetical protein